MTSSIITDETAPEYNAGGDVYGPEGDAIIERAIQILDQRLKSRRESDQKMESPTEVSQYLRLKIAGLEHEVFVCVWLDNKHRVIETDTVSSGNHCGASVHPRELVKRAMARNAAAVILAHNHPSGDTTPSRGDRHITSRIREALELVEVRVLDHLIFGEGDPLSFSDKGYL